ncbi:ABC-2 transporter permease [Amycolatopsis alkalitolerans]|uniref:ABC transporter permease n=1 Tax=Amycolatopsis alkalitolerans TaxID=2547244 RepID=A0A5C4M5W3_9PSEU|nr:ABC transporter permease [Amycolatopsis alkalitolerans]TNC26922.1 ABC transporter permease [Amycolatopsis alkalitolerans]
MIWLTWRQFRLQAFVVFGGVAALVAALAITGPGLAELYHSGLAACQAHGSCSAFTTEFWRGHQGVFFGLAIVTMVVPGLLGLFWGAPLIARELETGTHRLVWNQSVTRTRWLAVKLGLAGLSAMIAAGIVSAAVTWWSDPIQQTSAESPRLSPVLFAARDLTPVGYAAFAFALGAVTGMLVRRTIPAMAVTLAVFVGIQLAMPLWIRPHLMPPVQTTVDITAENLHGIGGGPAGMTSLDVATDQAGAWILSSVTVDRSGQVVRTLPSWIDDCMGPPRQESGVAQAQRACFSRLADSGYRQRISYQPDSRFWLFQWLETGVFLVLTAGLCGFGFWWIRRRLS